MTLPGRTLPIACDLGALSPAQREREQLLLAEFRAAVRETQETERGFRFVIPEDPELLGRLGEFLGLERLCCPFLTFELSIPAGRGPVILHVHGDLGAKSFLRSVFMPGGEEHV
jgi:hypothetical protein